jgi:hypothetical protein
VAAFIVANARKKGHRFRSRAKEEFCFVTKLNHCARDIICVCFLHGGEESIYSGLRLFDGAEVSKLELFMSNFSL